MKFEFEGIEDLTSRLEQMGRDSEKIAEEALVEAGKLLQKDVVTRAPRRAGPKGGTLKENILLSDVEDGQIEVYVDKQGKAYYGAMVELGTSKMRAQPFMAPAFNASKFKLEKKMVDVLRIRLGLTE